MTLDSPNDKDIEREVQNGIAESKDIIADDSQTSDNDGGERPVRDKLKKTSINPVSNESMDTDTAENDQSSEVSRESSRGRKRSFNDDQLEKNEDDLGHRRKRSRDSNSEEANVAETIKTDEGTTGLKKKRSRDQLDKDSTKDSAEKDLKEPLDSGILTEKSEVEGEPEKKRHRDDSQEREPASMPVAFANISSVSPFGSVGTSSPSKPVTSSSAFASSSLAAFAGSEKSPFGSLGSSTPSIFKSPATPVAPDTETPALSGFAAASKPSGFAALGSGFSGFTGGFGATSLTGGSLTSFASPGGSGILGGSSSKPFGAEEDSADDEGKEETGDDAPGEFAEEKTDERFYERKIETGEEEEKTYFSCKAKLFQFSEKEWKERGVGTFKVNVKVTDGQENKKMARLIMRADGVLRVMLNTPLFKGMKVGDALGNEPKSKQIHLASLENNRSVPILLRMGNEEHAKELFHIIQDLLEQI